jgi:hypothetical protein
MILPASIELCTEACAQRHTWLFHVCVCIICWWPRLFFFSVGEKPTNAFVQLHVLGTLVCHIACTVIIICVRAHTMYDTCASHVHAIE